MEWDGDIERRKTPTDHDNLIRVIAILSEHVKNFDDHVKEDKDSFQKVGDKLWGHARFIYIGLGAIGVIELLVGLHK